MTDSSSIGRERPDDSVVEVGATSIRPGPGGVAEPVGMLHLVEAWYPLCGAERVRFVFPGRVPPSAEICPACLHATVHRQPATAGSRAVTRWFKRTRTSPS